MAIKFSCAVPDIDQLILLLSIPEMWNLARKGSDYRGRKVFIKISCVGMRENVAEKERWILGSYTYFNAKGWISRALMGWPPG